MASSNKKKRKSTSADSSLVQKHQTPTKKAATPSSSSSTASTSSSSSGLKAQTKRSLAFPHEAFKKQHIESGPGLKYHQFSNVSFSTKSEQDDYITKTGLTRITTTTQDWGTGQPTTMHRSRRGSLVGLSPMGDGSIKGWRLHSLPTSEALAENPLDQSAFSQAYQEHAKPLTQSTVNSKGNVQSINTVLSDFAKVRFNTTTNAFEVYDATHSQGVSGKGLDNKQSSKPETLYEPSIQVAKADNKSGTPAQTYHSEPMAMTLHDSHRTTVLEKETSMLGMFASFPNQVCFQCGRTFEERSGKNAVVSGTPGVHFGGQHEGEVFNKTTGTTVFRAAPFTDLQGDPANKKEVGSIYDYHKH